MSNPKQRDAGGPPTLRDIALEAHTSIKTVSKVLRAKETEKLVFCSKRTAAHVREIARRMGYAPNLAARSMRTKKTGMIGFVTLNLSSEGCPSNRVIYPFLVGLNHVLAATGRHVSLIEIDELSAATGRVPDVLRQRFFDALIVQFGPSRQSLNLMEEFNVPVLYWDSGIFRPENCIYRDEVAVGRAVTRRLLDLGHRRITFCGNRQLLASQGGHYSFQARLEGYGEIMRENGLRTRIFEGYHVEDMAEHFAQADITGIVTHGDLETQLRAAHLLGKGIPQDLSLLSCDVETGRQTPPSLGGALYNRYETGRQAAQMMIQRLENEGASVPSRVLPLEISDAATARPLLTGPALSISRDNDTKVIS